MSFFPDRASGVPLHRQLAGHLRDAILAGELAGGTRLHAARALAQQLGVSRNTVVHALEQLASEGYLETRIGAGTYVASGLLPRAARVAAAPSPPRLAARARRVVPMRDPDGDDGPALFRPGVPDLRLFPAPQWRRVANRWLERTATRGYGDPAGYRPLREAIAVQLRQTRGVTLGADNVIVVEGTRAALALIADVLLDPRDVVVIEDPGYVAMREVSTAAGACIVPVPLDDEGFDPARAPHGARLAYVTPSHQYPTGVVMGLRRRLALTAWARANGTYVIEDDYDAEFRYDGPPLPALQGLDEERVLHVGTFSKTLAPGLRVGWIVVPDALVDAFAAVRAVASAGPAFPVQAALAAFVGEGHFALHVRRAAAAYRARRDALAHALQHELGEHIALQGAATGLHLVARLARDDVAASNAARAAGIVAPALSGYALDAAGPRGLVLGFGAGEPDAIVSGVALLARALAPWPRRPEEIGPGRRG